MGVWWFKTNQGSGETRIGMWGGTGHETMNVNCCGGSVVSAGYLFRGVVVG